MSFWSSDRAPDEAANVLCRIGEGFSKLEETGKLVEELTAFLENLESTFKSVENPKYDWIVRQAVQGDITAISEPLRKAEVDMLKFMGLNEDDLSLTPDIKSSTARIFWRTMYHEEFSAIITKLRDEAAIPLLGLHMSLAIMCPQNLPRTKKKFEGWAATSKRFIDKRLMYQAKEWLRPVPGVREQYQSYIDNVSFANCEWFFSKQQYIDWYNHPSKKGSPILWISGILGVGRTQIATRVVQKLREERRTVAYFFLGEATSLTANTRFIFAALCWEFLDQFPEDVDLLPEVRNDDGEPTEIEIQDCLLRICERRDAIILLDGLGQVSLKVEERGKLWQFLATLNRVCDVIIFDQEMSHLKQDLSDHDSIPHIIDCEADFWNEVEKVPTRYVAESRTQDEVTERGVGAKIESDEGIEEQVIRFPRSRKDQCRVYAMLQHRVNRSRLPAHVARQIIDEAEYLVKSTFRRDEALETNGSAAKINAPYLLSDPIEGTRSSPIRKIIAICKHNEVWRKFPGKNDDKESSTKYFDLIVRKADGSTGRIWLDDLRGTIGFIKIQSGDRIGVVPKAITPGLANFAETVGIEIFSTFIDNKDRRLDQRLRESNTRQEKNKILARIRNSAKQILSLTESLEGTEQELLKARYETDSQLSIRVGDDAQFLGKQNVPLPPSSDRYPSYSESTLRSRGSSISSYCEDADQLEPTTIPTITDKLNEQTPAHYTDRKDNNARSSISVAFVKMMQKLLRPAVRPGCRRLEWTCVSDFPRHQQLTRADMIDLWRASLW